MTPFSATLITEAWSDHLAGRRDDAEAICRRVLAAEPRHGGALVLLGVMAAAQGRGGVAARLLRMAADAPPAGGEPDHRTDALNRLGMLLAERGDAREAAAAFSRARDLAPGDAGVRRNLGKALWLAGELDAAVGEYEESVRCVLRARPSDVAGAGEALGELVNLHHARLDTRAAVAARKRLVELRPGDLEARSDYLVSLHYLPEISREALFAAHLEWGRVAGNGERSPRRHGDTEASPSFCGPSANESFLSGVKKSDAGHPWPSVSETSSTMTADLACDAPNVARASVSPCLRGDPPPRELRIGYLSGQFREYPMARFLAPVLAGHQAMNGFGRVTLYNDTAKPDRVTALLAERADAMVDVSGMSDRELDALLRREDLDLLVDLGGHLDNRRMKLLAGKPARRVAHYINYPNTLGIPGWGWRITDGVCDPVGESDRLSTETLLRLDGCAWAYDPAFGLGEPPAPSCENAAMADTRRASPPATRSPGPLPATKNGFVTFGVLARAAKLTPEAASLWAVALKAAPVSARLAVLLPAGIAAHRLMKLLTDAGVEADRIDLLEPGDRAHYLELHHRIDILLDAWPYAGMTATCDALWMGVPVITLAGDRHASRVGASLLSAVGLDECIARTADEYATIAGRLAGDVGQLRRLRAGLRERVANSPIADGRRIAEGIERLAAGTGS